MKANRPVVATLAVGTEITDGQISDRNSQWLSSRVVNMGYDVREHRAIPDDRPLIVQSLRDLAKFANLIFVTGGLGPTSDDFTRECVAEFLGAPLEWHEPSWESILERLKLRGGVVTENQKQQCFFPRGARILKNSGGTANAFMGETAQGVRIVSLPGPPGEIEAIWNESLRAQLVRASLGEESRSLTLLRTMGMGEGALASQVEEIIDLAMKNHPGVQRPAVGYRAHAPYVEIKLWAEKDQAGLVAEAAQRIRETFSNILVNEGSADVADAFLSSISSRHRQQRATLLIDAVTRAEILMRLHGRAREVGNADWTEALVSGLEVQVVGRRKQPEQASGPGETADVLSIEVGTSDLELVIGRGERITRIDLPKLASSLRTERGRKWAIEMALREWEKL